MLYSAEFDLRVYYHGALVVLGVDPSDLYAPFLGPIGDPGLPFTYPPFAALAFIPLAVLPWGVASWLSSALTLGAATVIAKDLMDRFTRVTGRRLWWHVLAWGAGVCVLVAPWRDSLWFGQINPVLMLVCYIDLAGLLPRVPRGLLIGLVAGIKLVPLALGLYFLARGMWRAILWLGAGFGATVCVGWMLLPHESFQYWFTVLLDPARVGALGYPDNISVRGFLARLVGGDGQTAIWLALVAVLIVATYWVLRRRRGTGYDLLSIYLAASLMLLISPVTWSHHAVWLALLIPIGVQLYRPRLRMQERSWWETAALWSCAALLAIMALGPKPLVLLLGSHPDTGPSWQSVVAGQTVAVLLLLTHLVLLLAAARTRLHTVTDHGVANTQGPSRTVVP